MHRILEGAIAAVAIACGGERAIEAPAAPVQPASTAHAVPATHAALKPAASPLLEPWAGPYGGVVPFDRVKVEQLRPALEAGMAQARIELAAIAASPSSPTFENTIAALEDAGRPFNRAYEVYSAWTKVMSTPEMQPIERELEPLLAAFWSESVQDDRLFRRIEAVASSSEPLTLEQQRLVMRYHRDFVEAGGKLDAAGRARVAEIDKQLASRYTSFAQNVRADEERCVVLERAADLAGLPDSLRAAAETAARDCGATGRWAVMNTRSAVAAFLTYSRRRDLRERVWRNYDRRGDHHDAHDNNRLITEILALRAERAKLLGYPTHAHWKLARAMLKTPERAMQLMETVWKPAVARVRDEVAAMRAIAVRAGQPSRIAPWDYRYYAEQVRKAKYDFDEQEARPYLQLATLRDGMFWIAGELFGLQFTAVTDVPVYHPDVQVYAVSDRATGRHVGLWYFDPYARAGKYNGGQTDVYRIQERFRGDVTALVSSNTPFVKPARGEPALLGLRDAQTLFHEFGHALNVLVSNATYPSVSGGRVVDDYAELPALLFEKWLWTPEVLRRFTRQFQTGEPIPAALAAKIHKAAAFNQGFYTIDYLTSALVEMKLHLIGDRAVDPDKLERDTLRQLGAPEEVGMRFRMPHFTHVFAGDSYAAGYYRYLWSDVLAADAFEAFRETGRNFDASVAARLREHVFSAGDTVDPFDGYRAFRSREPTIDALMRARGFAARPN